METKLILILDNIRSTYNVGSIFRTSDASGVSEIALCGITPQPIDRFGRDRSDIAKVSLGSEQIISWQPFKSTKEAIEHYQDEGFEIVALEQDDRSIDYTDFVPQKDVALVLGEETKGLSKDILGMCSKVIEIPMRGEKESLNVSVAAGIAMYEILK
jgi:23S rRNA (guanosine2251-2'-O)-methyltransferase